MAIEPLFFATPGAWRAWLTRHHRTKDELWVGFRKKGSGHASITWPESVDEALCYGWIDGLRKGIDRDSYMIRFTPRRRNSVWSAINVKRVGELQKARRMRSAGLQAFRARTRSRTGIYSFEQRKKVKLPAAFARRFKTNSAAWAYFQAQAPWYKRTSTWWVISAKQEGTRLRRLDTLIEDSANGRPIRVLNWSHPRNPDSSS
jgi:uncharacterized protein YdeI (YjbR/CyaY-like superfamily)